MTYLRNNRGKGHKRLRKLVEAFIKSDKELRSSGPEDDVGALLDDFEIAADLVADRVENIRRSRMPSR